MVSIKHFHLLLNNRMNIKSVFDKEEIV